VDTRLLQMLRTRHSIGAMAEGSQPAPTSLAIDAPAALPLYPPFFRQVLTSASLTGSTNAAEPVLAARQLTSLLRGTQIASSINPARGSMHPHLRSATPVPAAPLYTLRREF